VALLPPQPMPRFAGPEWSTDFSRSLVAWDEISSGGPPKDGIPSIDDPTFQPVADAAGWLSPGDPVLVFEGADTVRAYPLAILIWHEIVNDTVDGLPIAATFCPLCNASIVFDRRFEGQELEFGTTGLLRNSDLVMYDRQSESFWQQATGESIVGRHAGKRLTFLPAQTKSFAEFAAIHPQGEVLARPAAATRAYGRNPYVGYEGAPRPFLFDGPLDERLPALSRIVGISELPAGAPAHGPLETPVVWPLEAVAAEGVRNEEVAGTPLVLLHTPSMRSALDRERISEGREVGAAAVFLRTLPGAGDAPARTLSFERTAEGFRDLETGSLWNISGRATEGELAGARLTPVIAFDHYWFAWNAFYPESDLRGEE
jgi:hypothetical protein